MPAILWIGVIAIVSREGFSSQHTDTWLHPLFRRLLPGLGAEGWEVLHLLLRKLGHWTGYLILAAAIHRGFRKGNAREWHWKWALRTLALVLLVAAGDELHQAVTPDRTGSPWDSLLDLFGGACAIAFEYALFRRRARRASNPDSPEVRYPG